MKTILDALQDTLNTLREMSPVDYAQLDDDTWQLTQDISDCCSAIQGRVATLDALAPIPVKDIDTPLKGMHGVICYATQDALTQPVKEPNDPIEHDSPWETGPATQDALP